MPFQSKGERNYHVFYQVVKGAANAGAMGADSCGAFHYLSQSGVDSINGVDDEVRCDPEGGCAHAAALAMRGSDGSFCSTVHSEDSRSASFRNDGVSSDGSFNRFASGATFASDRSDEGCKQQ